MAIALGFQDAAAAAEVLKCTNGLSTNVYLVLQIKLLLERKAQSRFYDFIDTAIFMELRFFCPFILPLSK
jgi:hypothetical protein